MEEHAPGADARSQTSEVPNQTKPEAGAQRADSEILQAITDVIVGDAASPELFKKLVPTLQELANCNVVSSPCTMQNGMALLRESGKGVGTLEWASFFPWTRLPADGVAKPGADRDSRPGTGDAVYGIAGELRNLGVRSYTALPMSTPTHHYGSIGVGGWRRGRKVLSSCRLCKRAAAWLGLASKIAKFISNGKRCRTPSEPGSDHERGFSARFGAVDSTHICQRAQITTYDYARLGVLDAGLGMVARAGRRWRPADGSSTARGPVDPGCECDFGAGELNCGARLSMAPMNSRCSATGSR